MKFGFAHKTNFVPVKTIGKGGYSRVHLVRHKEEGALYAMKIISKNLLRDTGKSE